MATRKIVYLLQHSDRRELHRVSETVDEFNRRLRWKLYMKDVVATVVLDGRAVMYSDKHGFEEGKTENWTATVVLQRTDRDADPVCGTVVYTGLCDETGMPTTIADEVIAELWKMVN